MSMYVCPICGQPKTHADGWGFNQCLEYREHLQEHNSYDLITSYIKIHTKMIELETENRWLNEDVGKVRDKLKKIHSMSSVN